MEGIVMKQVFAGMIALLFVIAAAGCTKGASDSQSEFGKKLADLDTTFAAFEKVVEAASTIDEAKGTVEYQTLVKAQAEVDKIKDSAKMTDAEKAKMESLYKRIDLVVNQ
jgi:hypothetical protein